MQALTSGGGGMDAAIAAPDFVVCLCSVVDPDDQDCSKLVVEMLTKLCLYSVDGYCAALQVCLLVLAVVSHYISESVAVGNTPEYTFQINRCMTKAYNFKPWGSMPVLLILVHHVFRQSSESLRLQPAHQLQAMRRRPPQQ